MSKEEELKSFLSSLDYEATVEYSNRLYDNLKDLHGREERYTLWAVIIIFIYFILNNSTIGSFQIGPIGINDVSVISKILPLVFAYNLLNLYSIISQSSDVQLGLRIIVEKRFSIASTNELKKVSRENIISRIYYPHTIANAVVELFQKKPTIMEIIMALILFLPLVILAFMPHAILIIMLFDLFNNYCNDLFGQICFGLTAWTFVIILFYLFRTRDKK